MTGVRAGDLGILVLWREEKKKTALFTEKLPPASGLPGGTEVLCWKNRKPGFPGPARPPAGHLPQLPPILIASASHQLLAPLSILTWSIPLAGTQAKLPAKACSMEIGLSFRGAGISQSPLSNLYTAVNLTGTASLLIHEPPDPEGSPLRDQPQAFSVCVSV